MLEDFVKDVDSKQVLQNWLQPSPAVTAKPPNRLRRYSEFPNLRLGVSLSHLHLPDLHFTTSTTATGFTARDADTSAISRLWTAAMPMFPDGHVSGEIAKSLKPATVTFTLA